MANPEGFGENDDNGEPEYDFENVEIRIIELFDHVSSSPAEKVCCHRQGDDGRVELQRRSKSKRSIHQLGSVSGYCIRGKVARGPIENCGPKYAYASDLVEHYTCLENP